VRESFRTPQGPRSRTVCNITGLPEEVRHLVARALKGGQVADLDGVSLDAALDFGGLAVLRDAWERFGLDRLFESISSPRQRGLLKAMIFARVLFPSSKLSLADQALGNLLAAASDLDQATEDFDEDDLYEAMDELNGRWVDMEKHLYGQAFATTARLVLYDLTSVYFEGKGPHHLSRYGYSRDHRDDRPQMVLAVATDPDGIPIHLEVLRGNRADTDTLTGLLATLGRRFGIKEAVFVFDGGMSSKLNWEQLNAAELAYVTRLPSQTLAKMMAELPQDQQPDLGDRTLLLEVTFEGKRCVIAGGQWRAQRDEQRRRLRLQRAHAALTRTASVKRKKVDGQKLASQVGRMLQRLKAHKYFDYRVNPDGSLWWQERAEQIAAEEKFDGWYLLHTSLTAQQADASAVLAHYKNLLEVEEAFCQLKTYLEVRPIFHRRPDRVRNHVRICFLAYWITARLGRQWQASQEPGEVVRILRQLQSIRIGSISLAGKPLRQLMTHIPDNLNALLRKLNLLPLFAPIPRWV
jgi:transposase